MFDIKFAVNNVSLDNRNYVYSLFLTLNIEEKTTHMIKRRVFVLFVESSLLTILIRHNNPKSTLQI